MSQPAQFTKIMDTRCNVPDVNGPKARPETLSELALQTDGSATAGDRRTDYVLIMMHHHPGKS